MHVCVFVWWHASILRSFLFVASCLRAVASFGHATSHHSPLSLPACRTFGTILTLSQTAVGNGLSFVLRSFPVPRGRSTSNIILLKMHAYACLACPSAFVLVLLFQAVTARSHVQSVRDRASPASPHVLHITQCPVCAYMHQIARLQISQISITDCIFSWFTILFGADHTSRITQALHIIRTSEIIGTCAREFCFRLTRQSRMPGCITFAFLRIYLGFYLFGINNVQGTGIRITE